MLDFVDLKETISDLYNSGIKYNNIVLLCEIQSKDLKWTFYGKKNLTQNCHSRRHMGTNHGSKPGWKTCFERRAWLYLQIQGLCTSGSSWNDKWLGMSSHLKEQWFI